ncbi:hypothetical protein HN511_07000, partial [bacterium]|nr:hypothetical protein [bacterium]
LPAATSDDDKNFYRENLALLYVQDPLGFKQSLYQSYAKFDDDLDIDFAEVDRVRLQSEQMTFERIVGGGT